MGIFCNRKRQQEPSESPAQKNLRQSANRSRRNLVICFLLVAVFAIIRNLSGNTSLVPLLEDTQFSIVALDGTTHSFTYAEAESIVLFDDFQSFDRGELIEGSETRRICSGTFRNEEYGEYQLHAMKKLNKYIAIRRPEGVLVINLESDITTQKLYDSFTEDLNRK